MNKKLKSLFIIQKLDELYDNPDIPLKHKDSYTLLIAVLLSARCTDERVNKITPSLFKLADNPNDMILHYPEKIRKIIKPCGLSPRKSKSIYLLSKILVNEFNSIVPNNFTDLEILMFLTKNNNPPNKYRKLLKKLINE